MCSCGPDVQNSALAPPARFSRGVAFVQGPPLVGYSNVCSMTTLTRWSRMTSVFALRMQHAVVSHFGFYPPAKMASEEVPVRLAKVGRFG
jgi:hypothetical protein